MTRLRRSGTNYARRPPVPKRTCGRAKTRAEKPETDMQRAARGESLAPTVATEGTGTSGELTSGDLSDDEEPRTDYSNPA